MIGLHAGFVTTGSLLKMFEQNFTHHNLKLITAQYAASSVPVSAET